MMDLCLESCNVHHDLHLSSIEFSDSKCSVGPRKCDLCLNARKKFYCAQCIRNGDFYHSSLYYVEKFADLRNRLVRARREASRARDRCFIRLEAKATYKSENLLAEIKQRAEISRLLRDAIERQKMSLAELRKRRPVRRADSPHELLEVRPIAESRMQVKLSHAVKELEAVRRIRVRQLVKFIFPDCGKVEIPSPFPCNEDSVECRNILQAYHASAEMCLAAQLIALVSHYMDVRLPFPIDFGEYGTGSGSDEERHHRLCACAATLLRVKGLPPPPHSTNNVLASLSEVLAIGRGKVWNCGPDCPHCTAWDEWAVEWAGWTNWTDPVAERVETTTEPEDDWEKVMDSGAAVGTSPINRQNVGLGTSIVSDAAASIVSMWRGWTAK